MEDNKQVLRGRVSIGRLSNTSNHKDRCVRIELSDELSGLHVAEIAMTLEDFALALTGMGFVDCEFERYNNHAFIGKKREIRTETICIPIEDSRYFRMTPSEMEPHISPHLFDNWRLSGAWNASYEGKNSKDGKFVQFQVSFVRYVDPPQESE